MYSTGSFLETVSIYLVENVAQATLALVVVLTVIRLLHVNDAGLRVKFLLLPVILPLVGPPTYYALFPGRQQMPVLGVDRVFSIEATLKTLDWQALSPALTWAILVVIVLSFAGATLSIMGVVYLSRRYTTLLSGGAPVLDHILEGVARRAKTPPPRVLLCPDSCPICGAAGLLRPYLVLSRGLLDRLDHASLEAAVAHEMAHLRRKDHLLHIFVLVIRSLLFFNPAVLYLCNRILLESEKDCDRLALRFGISPSVYAESLLKVWRLGIDYPGRTERLLRSFLSSGSRVRQRVAALSGGEATLNPRQEGAWYVTAALLAVGLFFLC
ncbi:MAG: M56 family metallopeptidase [Chloroflexi bacterium]|nr:M56 family metallopeptidase [Chloroflexota bacterium]